MKIEFLYYDKTSCSRCAATNNAVKQSLKELKDAIDISKIDFKERKLSQSEINLSPSILINGKDIEEIVHKGLHLKSNECTDCCKLIGHPVNCRTFFYKGKTYDYIPKEMILEAISLTECKVSDRYA